MSTRTYHRYPLSASLSIPFWVDGEDVGIDLEMSMARLGVSSTDGVTAQEAIETLLGRITEFAVSQGLVESGRPLPV